MQLSSACLSRAGRPSVRHLNSGTGLSDGKEAANSLVDQGFCSAYILKKCGSFGQEKETARSLTRWNIFCSSRRRIRKNLKKTRRRFCCFRKLWYDLSIWKQLKSGGGNRSGVIAILLGLPEIKDLAATVILFAWAYAESVKDVRIFAAGDKIPLVKSEESWNTPFSQLLTYRSHLDSYRSSADG